MSDPIPISYGAANWTDYVNNWREKDAEWLQDRVILRYANAATRNTALNASATVGQFTFIEDTLQLELRDTASSWLPYRPIPRNMASRDAINDSTTQVVLAHALAGGKGIVLKPGTATDGLVDITAKTLTTPGGVLTADATGLSVKTGATTVKLTTDATGLVSDKPLLAPKLTLNGTSPVLDATGKSMVADSLTLTAKLTTLNLDVTGTLGGGGIVNGASGTIGGVALLANNVTTTGVVTATGFINQALKVHGDATNAYLRQRNSATGVDSSLYVRVFETATPSGGIVLDATANYFVQSIAKDIYLDTPTIRMRKAPTIMWYDDAATPVHKAYGAIVVYSATMPTASEYPIGTIWIQP